MKKKITTLLVILGMSMSLTSCKSGLQTFLETNIGQILDDRADANKKCAKDFASIGLISDKQAETMINNIDTQIAAYKKQATKTTKNTDGSTNVTTSTALDHIASSISQYSLGGNGSPGYITFTTDKGEPRRMPWKSVDEGKALGKSGSGYYDSADGNWVSDDTLLDSSQDWSLPNFILSNYIHTKYYPDNTNQVPGSGGTFLVDDKLIEPINLVGDADSIDPLNSFTKLEVYVLKPDILKSTKEATLDGAIAKIQSTIDKNDTDGLLDYFVAAKDSNGNNITLIDKNDITMNLIAPSKPNPGDKNEPGYDLIVHQYEKDVAHVRLIEFNYEARDKLGSLIGLDTERYYIVKNTKGESAWKAFLMEYPVQKINKLKNNGDNVDVTFAQSGLGYNIKTGQFVKYARVNGSWDTSKSSAIDCDDYYLTTSAAQNNDAEGISSLVVKGYATTNIVDLNGNSHSVDCGRIVLRDYLEATFAPECVEGENLVVFGRKIRFKMLDSYWHEGGYYNNSTNKQMILSYPKGENIAYFVDKKGEKNALSTNLQITDFCSAKALTKKKYKNCVVKRLNKIGEGNSTRKNTIKSGEVPKIGDLKQTVLADDGKSIVPTVLFPGSYIDKPDYTADSANLQRFVAITTTKGLFDSALFSDWINSTSKTASLDWWQTYLSNNGYSYKISHEAVNDYLNSNFKYELSQNGIVILDLDVVAKIQEQYDEEAAQQKTSNIRTWFMILGWAIIAYSLILMLSWVFDTNSDFGVKLLEKLTFGNWVAVLYEDDIPGNNANEQTYLTFSKLFLRCIIIIVIGIVLIRINIFNVVYVLIDVFGGLASKIENIIRGFS